MDNPHYSYKNISVFIFLWSLILLLSYAFTISNFEKHSLELASSLARDYWNKDSSFRAWATRHKGVYVPINSRTPPSPLLSHLPNRDIETTEGKKLTLMNPAYMMRQMTEEFEESYGVKGKITGQILLDPEGKRNKPDDWQLKALKMFDKGMLEFQEIVEIENEPYLRFMKPMFMTEGCVYCHGKLGFKVGDIRGGVSVSVPLKPYNIANETSKNQSIMSHLVIWLLGIAISIHLYVIRRNQFIKNKLIKERFDQNEKMNTLGNLTGGVAHDFNNILGVVMGYSEILGKELQDNPKLYKYANQIHLAGERGASLSKKLLNFSKEKETNRSIVNISELLLEQKLILENVLTSNIKLELDLTNNLWAIFVNKNDLEDCILNICINAKQSMDDGGVLTIKTINKSIDKGDSLNLGLDVGDYVQLSINDTGCGMDQKTKEQIFDPFYSTKGNKGTGLGLSQVFGFVKRSKGRIDVTSVINVGSQFVFRFPRNCNEDVVEDKEGDTTNLSGENEKILIVDDEEDLRIYIEEILNNNGYKTSTACDGEQALKVLATEEIDLVITDINMPKMDGFKMASIIHEQNSEMKIQVISGNAEQYNITERDKHLYKNCLTKPFTSIELLKKIRMLLNEDDSSN